VSWPAVISGSPALFFHLLRPRKNKGMNETYDYIKMIFFSLKKRKVGGVIVLKRRPLYFPYCATTENEETDSQKKSLAIFLFIFRPTKFRSDFLQMIKSDVK
jgi:hypothetical protein